MTIQVAFRKWIDTYVGCVSGGGDSLEERPGSGNLGGKETRVEGVNCCLDSDDFGVRSNDSVERESEP